MTVFTSQNYQDFLRAWAESRPQKGRGVFRAMAEHLRISPVLMSQIVNGSRTLSEDHAFHLCEFMGLSSLESECFLLMVQIVRAGTLHYRKHLESKLSALKKEAEKPKNRILQDASLSEEVNAIFYSHWKYSAVRLATSLSKLNTIDKISDYLKLNRSEVSDTMDFLLQHNLCIQTKKGFEIGPQRTHLPKESPFYFNRQLQLRNLGISSIERKLDEDFFYSAAVSVSEEDILWFREALLDAVSKMAKRIEKTDPSQIYCMNLDWFQIPTK